MSDLTKRLEQIVILALEDIENNFDSHDFKHALASYRNTLNSPINLYRDHSSIETPELENLKTRFLYETALLHVLTRTLEKNVCPYLGVGWDEWPVRQPNSYYGWYILPDILCDLVDEIAVEILASVDFRDFISNLSHNIRNKSVDYDLGEYYTPLAIVKHLIEITGFEAEDLIKGKRVIDPACGSGIILLTIAQSIVEYCTNGGCSKKDALVALSKNLYGFDVQPFAITLAKSLLIHACAPLLENVVERDALQFPNICLIDTLTTYNEYWRDRGYFHFVLGNPPFVSIKKEHINFSKVYEEILYGHPNLYQLFLWWAVKATVPYGKISFVLPQSILIGSYSKKLREKLDEVSTPLAFTRMIDRYGIVIGADQKMMVVCLKIGAGEPTDTVKVRVTRNGHDIHSTPSKNISRSRIVQNVASSTIWVVSDQKFDYTIVERIEKHASMLGDLSNLFLSGNGSFVWNQHKTLLTEGENVGSIPLVSSHSIKPYLIEFPNTTNHVARQRSFARVTEEVHQKQHSGDALLVQRTTPRKSGRRIVAGILPPHFQDKYPSYFLENHVNYIQVVSQENAELLFGLNVWLNSDIANFTFQLRNGTAHISLFELNILPVVPELLLSISNQAEQILQMSHELRRNTVGNLNETIYEWLGLGPKHKQRIEKVLQRKERSNH